MLFIISFIYYIVWKLWHWGRLFLWISRWLQTKALFSKAFSWYHSACIKKWNRGLFSGLSALHNWLPYSHEEMSYWQNGYLPCLCCASVDVLFCTTIQAKINESRLKACDHVLCTTLLLLVPNGCAPSPVLTTSLTTKAWDKQGSKYQATLFLLQVLF